ncbi:uncharacterized protein K452DRAFT_313048 [Aplosporella prunicola CBS 121167]|uniref:Heterokaryon incompatibility domain-containing protein n=1 Tax=Aplosporella prunicola CBS 121167 TaxID=1176127 RepID=A0A6A6AZJ8_9PEZI|nr:uncharacterized protein K452DRAFT_313048 [Aplosporella prunicola CBS 121167]KAF2136613.1 hypothetical protein K452DRAFT_313048 [Aplosporella prunicola CBS 121167]
MNPPKRRKDAQVSVFFQSNAAPKFCQNYNYSTNNLRLSGSSHIGYAFDAFRLIHSISEAQSLKDVTLNDINSGGFPYVKSQCRQFEALRQLMRSRWWDRMWTLQEVVIPQNLTLIYGSCVSTWNMFLQAANNISNLQTLSTPTLFQSDYVKVLASFFQTILDIEHMRKRWVSKEETSLLPLLRLVRSQLPIKPDYTLDVTEVFQGTALGIMKTVKNLSVLNGDIGRKSRRDLPSWVPDWTAEYHELDRRRADTAGLYHTCPQNSVYIEYEDDSFCFSGTRDHLCELKMKQKTTLGEESTVVDQRIQRFLYSLGYIWGFENCNEVLGHSDWTKFLNPETRDAANDLSESDCLQAVENFLIAQYGLAHVTNYRNGALRLSGHSLGTVLSAGPVPFGEIDLNPVIQSWILMLSKHLGTHEKWISFLTTLCAGIIYTKSDSSPQCRRIRPEEIKEIAIWLFHQPDAPLGKDEVAKNDLLIPFRVDIEHRFNVTNIPSGNHEILDVGYSIHMATRQRTFIVTSEGDFGLVPSQTAVGDFIYYLLGGSTPFVLRRSGSYDLPMSPIPPFSGGVQTTCFQLFGDCFLYGFMDGEAMSNWSDLVATAVCRTELFEAGREKKKFPAYFQSYPKPNIAHRIN